METSVGGAIGGVTGLRITAVIGLAIGVVAKLLVPGPDPGGWILTILLGLAGSWVGGFAVSMLGLSGIAPGLIGAVVGAMLLLLVHRPIKKG